LHDVQIHEIFVFRLLYKCTYAYEEYVVLIFSAGIKEDLLHARTIINCGARQPATSFVVVVLFLFLLLLLLLLTAASNPI